jgi:hypothetical protein
MRRVLLGLGLIAVSLAGLDCNQIFGLDPVETLRHNEFFEGCFSGPITEPPGPARLTVVFVAPDRSLANLEGCMQGVDPDFDASLAGAANEDESAQATVTVLPAGTRPAFALTVDRQPTEFANAVTVTLTNETGFPFKQAADLTRCALTCADLGIPQTFGPGGTP